MEREYLDNNTHEAVEVTKASKSLHALEHRLICGRSKERMVGGTRQLECHLNKLCFQLLLITRGICTFQLHTQGGRQAGRQAGREEYATCIMASSRRIMQCCCHGY